jgi:Holliday junction resolvasome RuvABC endonuclease subunit
MSRERYDTRIIAIDPTSRGFGYVVFEGPLRLINWAVVSFKDNRGAKTLTRIEELFQRYDPEIVAIENVKGSRRGPRATRLLEEVSGHASTHHIEVRRYSRAAVRQVFATRGACTKHEIAALIAKSYPELFPRLPRFRKPWMPEDDRMAIFDAASFALAYFNKKQKQSDTDRK